MPDNNNKYSVEDIARLISEDPDVLDIESASPAAPVAPTTPKVPAKPVEKPNPFKLPKGVPAPKPKGLKDNPSSITEGYDEFVNPETRQMFKKGGGGHPKIGFSKTKFMQEHGEDLAKKAYDHSSSVLYKIAPELRGLPPQRRAMEVHRLAGGALQRIRAVEARHKKELEQLAIDVVSRIYKAPKEIFKALLSKPTPDGGDESPKRKSKELDPSLMPQVEKRYLMNMLMQGAAVHYMHWAHLDEEIMKALEEKSKQNQDFATLGKLYSQFGRGSSHAYWMYGISMILGTTLGDALGTSRVTPDGAIMGTAVIFPILVQELVKGLMELSSLHQFAGMNRETIEDIYEITETVRDEFPQIMIGPKVWVELLSILPERYKKVESEEGLPHFVMRLAKSHPEEFYQVMSALAKNISAGVSSKGTTAQQALEELIERSYGEEEEAEPLGDVEDYGDTDEYNSEEDDWSNDDEEDEDDKYQ